MDTYKEREEYNPTCASHNNRFMYPCQRDVHQFKPSKCWPSLENNWLIWIQSSNHCYMCYVKCMYIPWNHQNCSLLQLIDLPVSCWKLKCSTSIQTIQTLILCRKTVVFKPSKPWFKPSMFDACMYITIQIIKLLSSMENQLINLNPKTYWG